MTAAKKSAARPPLARKVTPKDEKNRQDALDQGVRITLDGEVYEVRMGDLTVPLTRELRRNYGGSFQKLLDELATDPDTDSISTLVWLGQRIKGDEVDYDDVQVTYKQMLAGDFDLTLASESAEVEDNPEA